MDTLISVTVSVADQCDRSVRPQLPTPQFFPNQNWSMIAFVFMCPAPPGEVLGETYDYHGTRWYLLKGSGTKRKLIQPDTYAYNLSSIVCFLFFSTLSFYVRDALLKGCGGRGWTIIVEYSIYHLPLFHSVSAVPLRATVETGTFWEVDLTAILALLVLSRPFWPDRNHGSTAQE